jgi:hypothetical protein
MERVDYTSIVDPRLVYTNPSARLHAAENAGRFPVVVWMKRGDPRDIKLGLVAQMGVDVYRVPFPYQDPPMVAWCFRNEEDRDKVFGP